MIYYVTGPLGAGKTTYGARKLGRAFLEGRVVASNIKLPPDWSLIVAKHFPGWWRMKDSARQSLRAELERRYAWEPDMNALVRAKIHGKGEGRGVMLIDEAHLVMNNRSWEKDEQNEFIGELAHARKRGWTVYIIAQHADNTDVAARRIATANIQLLNWRQLTRMPLLGTPMLPVPLFLAMAFPLNGTKGVVNTNKVLFREVFTLGWTKRLFDTTQELFEDDDDDSNRIWLPLPRQAGAGRGAPGAPNGGPGEPATAGANLHSKRLASPSKREVDGSPLFEGGGTNSRPANDIVRENGL